MSLASYQLLHPASKRCFEERLSFKQHTYYNAAPPFRKGQNRKFLRFWEIFRNGRENDRV